MVESDLHVRKPRAVRVPHRPYGRHARVRERTILVGRVVVAAAALLVLAGFGAGWWLWSSADRQLADRAVQALVPDDPNIRTPGGSEGVSVAGTASPENVLVLGLNTRLQGEPGEGAGTERTGVMLLVHASADRTRIDLVSVPADLIVPNPGCQTWDASSRTSTQVDYVSGNAEWQIADAYAVGGPPCTVRAVQAITGLRVDRVIIIDENGFKAIVDSMGGIELPASVAVALDGRPLAEQGGLRTIDGDEALALIDAALDSAGSSAPTDPVIRQRALVAGILAQLTSREMLTDPVALNDTLQSVIAHSVTANVTVDDLAELALSVQGGRGELREYTLPTDVDPAGSGRRSNAATAVFTEALLADVAPPAAG